VTVHITCKTDRFNLSVVGAEFINECCFGEDFSKWLVDELSRMGAKADVICMEDYGWVNCAELGGITYLVSVGSSPAEDPDRPDFGEWHVLLERKRSLFEKLLGRNKEAPSDPLVGRILALMGSAGFLDVQVQA